MKKIRLILFLLLLIPSLVFAQGELHWLRIEDFSGGLNSDVQSWKLADNECTDSLNIYIDEIEQGISKRKGYTKANSTGTTSNSWLQSTTSDFNAGTLVNIDTTTVVDTFCLETSYWTQTSASDFASGTLVNIDTSTTSGTFRVALTTEAVQQEYTTGCDNHRTNMLKTVAQSFKPSIDCICTKIEVYIKKVGSPPESLKVYLKADNNNSPGDTLANTTISASDVGTSYDWEIANITDTNLIANTRYWIYFAWGLFDDESNQHRWGVDETDPTYANGNLYYGTSHFTGVDTLFKIYEQHYQSSSNLISQIGDLGAIPTAWGTFEATQDLNEQTIDWYIQTSSSSDMSSPTGWIAVTNNTTPSVTLNRYVQWKSVLNASGNATPVVYDVTINGKVPSSLTSQSYDCTDVFQWGRLEANDTLNGQTITYAVRTSSYSGGLASATWYNVVSGNNITAPVNRYAQWISTLTSTGSQTPVVNNVTIYWYSTPTSLFDYPITSLHRLKKSDASEYMWAVSSGTIWGSDDAGTFVSVKSGMSTTYDVNWANIGDSAYCVDGSTWAQKFTAYDSCAAVTTVPRGRFIIEEGYRLWVGYPVGYPNRLYYSDLADDTTWDWVYIPGEGEITGLGKLQGSVIVYKTNSVWKVIGVQVSTEEDVYFVPSLVNLSSEVGCINYRSIQNFRLKGYTVQLFLGKDNVYATNGVAVIPVGDKIENTIEDLKQATFASSYSWLETNFFEGTSTNIDTTTVLGTLRLALPSTTWEETTTAHFGAGLIKDNIDTSSNEIKLNTRIDDTSNICRTRPALGFSDNSKGVDDDVNTYAYYRGPDIGTQYYTVTLDGAEFIRKLSINLWAYHPSDYKLVTGGDMTVYLEYYNGAWVTYSSTTLKCYAPKKDYRDAWRSAWTETWDGLSLENVSKLRIRWVSPCNTDGYYYYRICELQSWREKWTTGHFRSQEKTIDSGSLFGKFYESHLSGQNYILKVRKYSGTGWSSWVTVTNGDEINLSVGDKIQYDIVLTSNDGAINPIVYDVKIEYYTSPTGSFISQVHDCGTAITFWGNFTVNSILNNQTISYQVRSSTWSGAIDGTSWYDVVPGGLIPAVVNRFVQWKATLNTTDGSKTPVIDDVSVYWWAGAFSGSSPASVVYDDRYHLFAMTSGSDVNDIDLVLNKDGAWTKNDIKASSAIIYNEKFYTGSSTTTANGSWLYEQDIGYSDDLQPINSYWQSKDYDLGIPYKDKTLRKIWTVCKRVGAYPLKLEYIMNLNESVESYDIWLCGSACEPPSKIGIVPDERHIPATARAKFFKFRISNSGENEPFELYRIDAGFQKSPGWSEP